MSGSRTWRASYKSGAWQNGADIHRILSSGRPTHDGDVASSGWRCCIIQDDVASKEWLGDVAREDKDA